MTYMELKEKNQKKVDNLPVKWAFSNEQFNNAMKELNLDPESDLDKIVAIGCGGFMLKEDEEEFTNTVLQMDRDIRKAMKDDQFMIEALSYELANHEYSYTGDPADALEALNLSIKDEQVQRCLKVAINNQGEMK